MRTSRSTHGELFPGGNDLKLGIAQTVQSGVVGDATVGLKAFFCGVEVSKRSGFNLLGDLMNKVPLSIGADEFKRAGD